MSTNVQKKKQEELETATARNEAETARQTQAYQYKRDKAQFDKDYAHARASMQAQQPATGVGSASYSSAVQLAKDQLNAQMNPNGQQTPWGQALNDAWNKIQNREKFSYDLNGDALYQQYKDQYMTQGQMAMMDTMGQAAALTGGYGSSYTQGVGQQAYQGYLQQLNDRVPELYQLALDQYNREGDELYNQYGLIADRENTEYNRAYQAVRDAVSDEQWNKSFDRSAYEYDTSLGWDKEKTGMEFDYQYATLDQDDRHFNATNKYNYDVLDWQKESHGIDTQLQYDKLAQDDKHFNMDYDLRVDDQTFNQTMTKMEYEEMVRQYDQDYELKEKQILADIENGKISQQQGWAQIQLERDKLEENKRQANQSYNLNMAELNKKYTTTTKTPTPAPTPKADPEPDYSSWTGTEWSKYFAEIRKTEGVDAAVKELNEMNRKGLIPKQYLNGAGYNARGSYGH